MLNFTWLSDDDDAVLRSVTARDWRSDALRLGDAEDEALAAKAVALGAVACHGLGNVYAISTHPSQSMVRYVNQATGRAADQPGSVTTLRPYIPDLFDWSKLPEPLTRTMVLELIDRLLEVGPFGFRGPAADHLPDHLTTIEDDSRTVELIGAGYRCPSRRFIGRCLEQVESRYLHVAVAHPAHYRLRGVQHDLGELAGVVMLAHRDERRTRAAYAKHAPSAPTVLSFQDIRLGASNQPILLVERQGSLPFDALRPIVAEHGFGVELGPTAQMHERVREYDDNDDDLMVA